MFFSTLSIIQMLLAILSSFAAVMIGSGGDILFLSGMLLIVSVIMEHALNAYSLGPLVAIQGIIATLMGGVAYARISSIPFGISAKTIGATAAGSLFGSVVARSLPSIALQIVLAAAITGASINGILQKKSPNKGRPEGFRTNTFLVLTLIFAIACLTGGLGVGGGFLFYFALRSIGLSTRATRGLTLMLTFANLLTSFLAHIASTHANFQSIVSVGVGALVGSLVAVLLLRAMNEHLARWGLQILLVSSAVFSWISILRYAGL